MFRFTIRELVLVTVIVALGLGWWIDHQQHVAKVRRMGSETRDWRFRAGALESHIKANTPGRISYYKGSASGGEEVLVEDRLTGKAKTYYDRQRIPFIESDLVNGKVRGFGTIGT